MVPKAAGSSPVGHQPESPARTGRRQAKAEPQAGERELLTAIRTAISSEALCLSGVGDAFPSEAFLVFVLLWLPTYNPYINDPTGTAKITSIGVRGMCLYSNAASAAPSHP